MHRCVSRKQQAAEHKCFLFVFESSAQSAGAGLPSCPQGPWLWELTRGWRPDGKRCFCLFQEGPGEPAEDDWKERRRLHVTSLGGGIRGEHHIRVCVCALTQPRVDNAAARWPQNALNFSAQIRRLGASPPPENGALTWER